MLNRAILPVLSVVEWAGWLLWNPSNVYTTGALAKEPLK